MPIPKIIGAQRDFSAGELDVTMKRSDEHPIMKIGTRQLSNFRILNSGAAINRPGRSALFLEIGRVDEVLMAPGQIFYLVFGNGYLRVYNAAGTQVFSSTKKGDGSTNIPWTTATIKNIVFVVAPQPQFNIYITYADDAPLNVPQILNWDGVSQSSTWTLSTYAEANRSGQKRTIFYRLSPQNITLRPSATTGTISLVASAPVFVSGQIGTRIRYAAKELTITAVADSMHATATVNETLPFGEVLDLGATPNGSFNPGDVVLGSPSGAQGVVIAGLNSQQVNFAIAPVFVIGDIVTGGTSGATGIVTAIGATNIIVHQINGAFVGTEVLTNQAGVTQTDTTVGAITLTTVIVVQILPNASGNVIYFRAGGGGDVLSGPSGSSNGTLAGINSNTLPPQAIAVWDDEVMNLFRGFPKSVFFDQSRLGFTNFPALPSGIVWSAIGLATDLYTGALPAQSIFELVPGKSQVQFVMPGLEGSEFIFCDNAIYYIPITPANPLVPGSVAFNQISSEGAQPNVQPRQANQSIIYMKAGGLKVGAVQVPGTYYRPYVIDDVSEYHGHLFTPSPVIAIAIPSAANQFEELYAYILFANGSLAIGKYQLKNGLLDVGQDGKPKIGWLPWSGAGTSTWVSAQSADVILTSSYAPISVVERVDNSQYLDSALPVNSLPAPFTPPGGKGPLFKFPGPNSTVVLIDLGTRVMGTYQVDANGFIIPQFTGGENLSSAQLVAGQSWTALLEVFAPDAQPGQDVRQRMLGRRVSRMGTYVSSSTGFVLARLFSGPLTPTSPALGTIMNIRRIPTYNVGDDATQPPPLREEMQRWRPLGRSFDPRVAVIKDTPGSLLVHEIGIEVSL